MKNMKIIVALVVVFVIGLAIGMRDDIQRELDKLTKNEMELNIDRITENDGNVWYTEYTDDEHYSIYYKDVNGIYRIYEGLPGCDMDYRDTSSGVELLFRYGKAKLRNAGE